MISLDSAMMLIEDIIELDKDSRNNIAFLLFDKFDEEDCATFLLNVELIRRKLIEFMERN